MDDFRNIKDIPAYAAYLGHIIAERAFLPNYKNYIDERENAPGKEQPDVTTDFNTHTAGKIFEAQVLAEFFTDANGNPIKLRMPTDADPVSVIQAKLSSLDYGRVKIVNTPDPKNGNIVVSAETVIKDPSIILKK